MKKNTLFSGLMAILLIFFIPLASCLTSTAPKTESETLVLPRQSFVLIRSYAMIKICKESECKEDDKQISSGSGFVVAQDKFGSYVLTAGHICESILYDSYKKTTEEETKKSKVSIKFFGLTISHDKHELHIVKVNKGADLCMMYSPGLKAIPIPIARHPVRPGERIYNIAAPLDIMHKNAPIMVDGIYSGRSPEMNADVYTMIVDYGSSGSPIINGRGEMIGVVSMKNTRFDFLAYSPPTELIRYFVLGIVRSYSPEPIIGL